MWEKIRKKIKIWMPIIVGGILIVCFIFMKLFGTTDALDQRIKDQKKKIDQKKKELDLLKKKKDQEKQKLDQKIQDVKDTNEKIKKDKEKRDEEAENFFPNLGE